jgi:hypothetical protein
MSEHDYNLINQTGANLRADLNSVLSAIVSQNSKATEPTTMFAYMFWADTTAGLLKQRNAANTAWIEIGTLASANLGLALVSGLSTQVFSAAAATSAAHVVRADQIQAQSVNYFTTAGTSTAYTLTPSPAITAYAIGQEFDIKFNAANGATATINVSGLGAVNLVDRLADGTYYNIPAGRIPINWVSKGVMVSANQMLVRDTPCETITSTLLIASGITLTTATAANVTSISVPPGDWEIFGNCIFTPAATTVKTANSTSISATSATFGSQDSVAQLFYGSTGLTGGTTADYLPLANFIVHLTATTTYYLISYSIFTTSTMKAAGTITARRYK